MLQNCSVDLVFTVKTQPKMYNERKVETTDCLRGWLYLHFYIGRIFTVSVQTYLVL